MKKMFQFQSTGKNGSLPARHGEAGVRAAKLKIVEE